MTNWKFRVEYIDADKYAIIISIGTDEFRSETSMSMEEVEVSLKRMIFNE